MANGKWLHLHLLAQFTTFVYFAQCILWQECEGSLSGLNQSSFHRVGKQTEPPGELPLAFSFCHCHSLCQGQV